MEIEKIIDKLLDGMEIYGSEFVSPYLDLFTSITKLVVDIEDFTLGFREDGSLIPEIVIKSGEFILYHSVIDEMTFIIFNRICFITELSIDELNRVLTEEGIIKYTEFNQTGY